VTQPLIKQSARFSETVIDDEVVVMSLESGDFFSLTGTARDIWMLIDGTRDRAVLLSQLAARYECPEAEIAEDINAFLEQLNQAGLLGAG
jgi:pyrroloquinoline quinone biosynthesis protein D